jgi:membrane protein DedA with SNARE-associated domain
MSHALTTFVENHGVLAILLLMTADSCGAPFASEVIMSFGGYFAAAGHLNIVAVILAGTGGNLAGSLIAYWLAAQFGEPLLLGPGRWIGIRRSHVESADAWFRRHGLAAVFVGRLVPVVRTYVSFPAGLARVELARFTVLTFTGVLIWCSALAAAGYAIGASYDRVTGPIGKAAVAIAIVVVLLVVAWFVRGRRARREGAAPT